MEEKDRMNQKNRKCVMVIDRNLPMGLIANTAAIMGVSLGKKLPDVVGRDVYDRTGKNHPGIIEFPIPILRGDMESIRKIRERMYEPEFADLTVVDFTDLARRCKTYEEFCSKMGETEEAELRYFGTAVCGDRKKIDSLTGSMALLG